MRDVLSSRVLVLNRLWQAVHIVSAKRATSLLFTGHARVLHQSENNWQVWPAEDWLEISGADDIPDAKAVYLHTVNRAIRLPKVLLLNEYASLPLKEIHLNRQSVFERDDYHCQYCGKRFKNHQLNLDHVTPKDQGGQFTWANIVTSCLECNSRKANRTPREAGMRLLRRPKQPKSRPFVSYIIGQEIEAQWRSFLNLTHEETEVEIVRSERLFTETGETAAAGDLGALAG